MATPTLVQSSKNSSVYPTSPLNLVLKTGTTAGNALIIAVEGAKTTSPYPLAGLNSATSAPTVKDDKGNTYTAIESQINYDGDLGYFVSVFLYHAINVQAGITTLTVTNADANGRPTYNHGLSAQAYEFSGIATAAALDGHASQKTSATTSHSGTITPTAAGDLQFVLGAFRKSSNFFPTTGFTFIDAGRLDGTPNDYWAIAYTNATTTATITNIALTTNVVTVTCANAFAAGQLVTFSGLTTATYLNGQTVIVASASGTQFTAPFTHANDVTHADTGTAAESAGTVTPGFANNQQIISAVAAVSLKHS